MKFSVSQFTIDKKYDTELPNKIAVFKKETGTRKSVFLTMVTTFGLQQNNYAPAWCRMILKWRHYVKPGPYLPPTL